jgi:hypothetical protein
MKTQFYDLKIESQEDGTIRLEQGDCGEAVIIDLHPQQILYMADCLRGRASDAQTFADKRINILESRLLWAYNRFNACHAALPSDLYERCSEAPEFSAWLEASLDVLTEYCADIEGVVDSSVSDDALPPHPLPADAASASLQGAEHVQRSLLNE